jgi:two-component system chemotaxis sensor kinase CheA
MGNMDREPMVDLFIYECNQLIEQLEQLVLDSEKAGNLDDSVNEIFRIMHTIKGSAAMMLLNNIAELAHKVEDLFAILRAGKQIDLDVSQIIDLVLQAADFFKTELGKMEQGNPNDGDPAALITTIETWLAKLEPETAQSAAPAKGAAAKPADGEEQKFYIASLQANPQNGTCYRAVVKYADDCEMVDVRALTLIRTLREIASEIRHYPEDVLDNQESIELIKNDGFKVFFQSHAQMEELQDFFGKTPFMVELTLEPLPTGESNVQEVQPQVAIQLDDVPAPKKPAPQQQQQQQQQQHDNGNGAGFKQSMISVNLQKLDVLMDLVGEMVIAEAMVTRHPELAGLPLENFHKSAQHLQKITHELQDVVMSIRMVPLTGTFQKMNRIVRDMSRHLKRQVDLVVSGAETEVDKNIIEHISDPLMHLIRNAIDHGIESVEERLAKGKSEIGKVFLEAKNAGGEVLIIIKDDGRGLNRDQILEKAKRQGLLKKPEQDLTEREIFNFILLPGFSTNEKVTEYSGRGVGMDVVVKSLEAIGGKILIDSVPDAGSTMTLKIPLTLAIIDGMTIKVGDSLYTVPTTSIRESFRMKPGDLITDPDGNEMIMIRGNCYPIVRLHEAFRVKTAVTEFTEGITMMVENNDNAFCVFADELLGEQQVVVKALPKYVKKIKGIAGCTLLGNGEISLILDVGGLQ